MDGVIGLWFNPRRVRAVGSTPDYRFSLANERTFLAWLRTGLALIGGGIAVAQFLSGGRLIALALLATGATVSVRGLDNWARSERAMRLGEDLPPSRFPAVLALTVALGAIVVGVAIAVGVLA
jgi:putative membrane protein